MRFTIASGRAAGTSAVTWARAVVVSGADGGYLIRNVPPGSYTLEVWHETFGHQAMPVTVAPSAATTADFTLKAAL